MDSNTLSSSVVCVLSHKSHLPTPPLNESITEMKRPGVIFPFNSDFFLDPRMLIMASTIILSKKILRNLKVQAAHTILCY